MRMLGWVSRMMLTALLVSTVSMLSTWTVIQLYVERVLEAYHLPSGEIDVKFTDFLAQVVQQWPQSENKEAASSDLNQEVSKLIPPKSEGQQEEQTSPAEAAEHGQSSPDNPESESDEPMPGAVAVWGSAITESETQSQQSEESEHTKLLMSAEEFNQKREQLSDEDKLRIFTLVMTRLPKDQLQQISTYMENGVTQEELESLLAILQHYLQPEEMSELMEIVEKY